MEFQWTTYTHVINIIQQQQQQPLAILTDPLRLASSVRRRTTTSTHQRRFESYSQSVDVPPPDPTRVMNSTTAHAHMHHYSASRLNSINTNRTFTTTTSYLSPTSIHPPTQSFVHEVVNVASEIGVRMILAHGGAGGRPKRCYQVNHRIENGSNRWPVKSIPTTGPVQIKWNLYIY